MTGFTNLINFIKIISKTKFNASLNKVFKVLMTNENKTKALRHVFSISNRSLKVLKVSKITLS